MDEKLSQPREAQGDMITKSNVASWKRKMTLGKIQIMWIKYRMQF